MKNRAIIPQNLIATPPPTADAGEIMKAPARARRAALDRGNPHRALNLTMSRRIRNEASGFPQRLLHV